jgi:hypothetical protein
LFFCSCVCDFVLDFVTYLTAIDELYRIYGANTSVTDIINRMRTERVRVGRV